VLLLSYVTFYTSHENGYNNNNNEVVRSLSGGVPIDLWTDRVVLRIVES